MCRTLLKDPFDYNTTSGNSWLLSNRPLTAFSLGTSLPLLLHLQSSYGLRPRTLMQGRWFLTCEPQLVVISKGLTSFLRALDKDKVTLTMPSRCIFQSQNSGPQHCPKIRSNLLFYLACCISPFFTVPGFLVSPADCCSHSISMSLPITPLGDFLGNPC